jgi:hypothetical protein
MYMCVYVCVYVCMYVCVYVCMYVYVSVRVLFSNMLSWAFAVNQRNVRLRETERDARW